MVASIKATFKLTNWYPLFMNKNAGLYSANMLIEKNVKSFRCHLRLRAPMNKELPMSSKKPVAVTDSRPAVTGNCLALSNKAVPQGAMRPIKTIAMKTGLTRSSKRNHQLTKGTMRRAKAASKTIVVVASCWLGQIAKEKIAAESKITKKVPVVKITLPLPLCAHRATKYKVIQIERWAKMRLVKRCAVTMQQVDENPKTMIVNRKGRLLRAV